MRRSLLLLCLVLTACGAEDPPDAAVPTVHVPERPAFSSPVSFVVQVDDRSFVVLDRLRAPVSTGGEVTLVAYEEHLGEMIVSRPLDDGSAGRTGDAVTLASEDVALCSGHLGAPLEMRWVELFDVQEDETHPERRALEVEPRERLAVAELLEVDGDCFGATYAVDDPSILSTRSSEVAEPDALLDAFRRTGPYREIQAFFEEDGYGRPWHDYDNGEISAERWVDASGVERFLVHARAGYGCGDLSGSLWTVFERDGSSFRAVAHGHDEISPDALVLSGGRLSIRFLDHRVEVGPDGRSVREDVGTVAFICPC